MVSDMGFTFGEIDSPSVPVRALPRGAACPRLDRALPGTPRGVAGYTAKPGYTADR
ncbi:hypothetical protein Aph01nite_27610 [Acrocarpospora phusangensis]|uniref:Uncharacterized protein n=1 Tax=Acrocarpospora phusangensis TaxID=1070424 RepID=A0A919UK07_9ACTN|nr:hypothetical protein Aph01nite_27610 [Acrocarpospora phusangensis]